MPMPEPNDGETKSDFMDRCMGDDVMVSEYPDEDQRYKVCEKQWDENRGGIMEIRGFKFETREAEDEGHFEGIANAYDVIDDYGSKFQRGAFKKTLEEQDKIPLVWFHDPTQPIGQARAWETDGGLEVDGELDLNIQKAQEVYSGMQMGYVDTMSIGFETIQSDTNSDGIEIKKEAKLYEASPLTQNFAANPGAEIGEVRSTIKGIRRINQSIKDETKRDLDEAINELRQIVDELDTEEEASEEESIDEVLKEARKTTEEAIARVKGGSRETTSDQDSPQGSRSAGIDPQIVEEIERAANEIN